MVRIRQVMSHETDMSGRQHHACIASSARPPKAPEFNYSPKQAPASQVMHQSSPCVSKFDGKWALIDGSTDANFAMKAKAKFKFFCMPNGIFIDGVGNRLHAGAH